jgi:hypothetical protein
MQLDRLLPYLKILCAALGFLGASRADGCFFYLLFSATLLLAIITRNQSLSAHSVGILAQPLLLLVLYQALVFAGEAYRLGYNRASFSSTDNA